MTTTQNASLEADCQMITIYINCVQCAGSGEIRRDVEWSIYQELITCPNCDGDTVTPLEVCNHCRQTEDTCKCLEVLEVEREEQLEAVNS